MSRSPGPFKRPSTYERGLSIGQQQRRKGQSYKRSTNNTDSDLIGEICEASIEVYNIPTKALLDTGLTVSTISHKFYNDNFSDIPIQKLDTLLNIECADGKNLPYEGFIETHITSRGLSPPSQQNCILLVIPDSSYSTSVPIILGTNIFSHFMKTCQQEHGTRFLQRANLHTPWYLAFRCITLREKMLMKNKFKLGVVLNAEYKNIIIQPNHEVVVSGYVDQDIPYKCTIAMMHPTDIAAIPEDIDIAPTQLDNRNKDTSPVDVHISNVTTRTVIIYPT